MKIPILYFCTLIGVVLGQSIVRPPTDTTGTIGGKAKFQCTVQYGEHIPFMNWLFNDKIIYSFQDGKGDYPFGTNKYVVNDFHTTFTLEARNLTCADGGNYFCKVMGNVKSAALIVLGSPVITQEPTNLMEGTEATFICEAKFGGPSIDTIVSDHQPQIKLFLDDFIYQAQSDIKKDNFIRKVYEIPVHDSMDSKNLKCEIGTTKSKQNITSSTLINVLYSVRDITYSPKEQKYEFGSNITCSARGNPIPLIEWRNNDIASIIIKGQLLYIVDDMVGTNSWRCTARNYVGGKMYEDELTAKFEAVSHNTGNSLQDNVDLGPVFFLIAAGCLAAGTLGFIAIRRARAVITKIKKGNVTATFYMTTAATVFGSSFQHGWNTGVLNIPQLFIKSFINGSCTDHYGYEPSSGQLEMLWAVCVSVYLLSGCFGVLVASKMADTFGRKGALLFCHPFGIIAAILFGFCKMAHCFEMLIIGRVIVGFSCGAGSRLVLKYLTEIAPYVIQNEVLVVHQFGITFGILLSQVVGLHHCLGNVSLWPYLLSLTALPSVVSFFILLFCPKSPIDHLIYHKREEEEARSDNNPAAESNSQHTNNNNDEDQKRSCFQRCNKVDNEVPHRKNAEEVFVKFRDKKEFNKYAERFMMKKTVTESELFQSEWKPLFPFLILLCGLNVAQQLSGINVIFYYSLNVFEASGVQKWMIEYCVLSTGVINVLMTGLSIVGNFKHRQLLFIGMSIMIVSSLLITLGLHLQISYISLLCVNTFVVGFALELGSITTYIGRALFIQGPRTPAITIAGTWNWFANFCVALVYPFLHLRAGPNSFWIFTSFLLIFTIYFFAELPGTKDQDIIDIYKDRKIPKRYWPGEDETELSEQEDLLNNENNATSDISTTNNLRRSTL